MSERTLNDCRQAATRTVDWLAARIKSDGSLGDDCQDLACFYKLPYLMQLAGHAAEAHRLLDCIHDRFLRQDGDFLTADRVKTVDPVLALYPGYINGWIAMAAHKLGRFDLSFRAWGYLRGFWNVDLGGFVIDDRTADGANGTVEVLMCAHLGLVALYLGDLESAQGSGRALQQFLALQPSPDTHFFLRMTGAGMLQTDFPAETAGLHVIAADQPGQAWFFIGYPMAFLTRLFRVTGEPQDLASARGYFDFAERCASCMLGEHFAHKVAWGAAELARVTGDAAPRALGAEITKNLIAAQDRHGSWMGNQPSHTRLDQSAEVAIWLLEIVARG
jgi:hypothetical protein